MNDSPPAAATSPSPKGASVAVALVLLAFLGVLAYAGTFHAAFLPDDEKAILENASIRTLTPLSVPFSPPLDTSVTGRPLGNFCFALNWAVSGNRPFGYHAVNLLFHILCSFVLFGIVRRTLALPRFSPEVSRHARTLAFFVSALWLCHPLDTQAVTHITQRLEVLMGLLFLSCLYFAIRGFGSARPAAWQAASVLCFTAGIFVKEVIVAAPFCLLLYDTTFLSPGPRKALSRSPLLYGGLALGLGLLFWHLSGGELASAADAPISPLLYLFTQTKVVFLYLRQIFWPDHLSYDHRMNLLSYAEAWPWFALLTIGGIVTVVLLIKRSPLGFLCAWFLLILAPTSSIKPLRMIMVDYRPYLSLAAVSAFVVVGGFGLAEKMAARSAGAKRAVYSAFWGLCAVILAALCTATYTRNQVYRTTESLWTDTVEKSPANFIAYHNLGNVLLKQGKYVRAAGNFEKALALHPGYYEARLSYGVSLVRQGRLDEAIAQMQKALEIFPDYPEAHLSLGTALAGTGRFEEAEEHLKRALALSPGYVNALNNLGLLYSQTHRPSLAEPLHRRAIELAPDRPESYSDLGVSLARQGKTDEALRVLGYALTKNPNDPVAAAHQRAPSARAARPGGAARG
ncbi:MAG: tetratricopeptide repeat protein, partial [Thermodesulfobacteriota bacterium]